MPQSLSTARRSLSLALVGVAAVSVALASTTLALSACDDAPPGHGGGKDPVDGGFDAGCPSGPQPMFTLTITATDGPVPPDTSLDVHWSVGSEPTFKLDDTSTWKSLEMGTNVVCGVDPANPPPEKLTELVCSLWTNGATEVTISADGYVTYIKTLVPMMNERCEGPIPTGVDVELTPDIDAGALP